MRNLEEGLSHYNVR